MLPRPAGRRFRPSVLLQPIAPTRQITLGVLLWGEPFAFVHVMAFIAIWVAPGLYTMDMMRARGKPQTVYP
jgi:chloramphenicol-sensitive protein RarD